MPETITPDSLVAAVAGRLAGKLETALQLSTVADLLAHYPRSYVRKNVLDDVETFEEGLYTTCFGEIARSEVKPYRDRRSGRQMYRLELYVRAGHSGLAMTFFDAAKHTSTWRSAQLAVGRYGLFSGKLKLFREQWQLTNPQTHVFVEEGDGQSAFGAVPELVPIYPAATSVQTWELAEAVKVALDLVDHLPDVLPEDVRREHDLLDAATALRWIHRPDSWAQKTMAEERLKLDEALVTQTVLARRRRRLADQEARPRPRSERGLLADFDARLPFDLTAGQREVGDEVAAELARPHPMHRLLQGEVGSGKTVVALRAMLQVVDAGGQAALLAPTEVLAQQHHRSLQAMLGDLAQGGQLGGAEHATRVALLTGSLGAAARRQALADAAGGEAGIVVGTHALLEDRVQFFDLGLVVVDEQHRFGVEQRAALVDKAGVPPHVLVMTATPIPRTVAMTVFGDLDTSTLRELPAGRAEVRTTVVPEARLAWVERAWERVREEVDAGRQAYVVCPRIGDEPASSAPPEGPELHAVVDLVEELEDGPLAGVRIAMMHGRLPAEEKDRVMRAFSAGEVDVLVSTTVVEVGVDVPNASVMVVMDAQRFGVSQLHQLRGRIGRGGHEGLCLLVTGSHPGSVGLERLEAVAATRDGFELSRVDLQQRREGDVLGRSQSGQRSTLKLLSVIDDEEVISTAREVATVLVGRDPELFAHPDLRRAVVALEHSDHADYLDRT